MMDTLLAKHFLKPKSIAIVGASADPKKTGSRIQRFLIAHGYKGKIYPVNPNRDNIFGLKCYQNLRKINKKVDHIFIALDGDKIIDSINDAISIGVKCATILSGGFSEFGLEGANLENKILDIAQKGNLRILGPNSIGIINISDSVILSANAMLELPNLKKGGLSVISQSGSLIGALLAHGTSRGIGFSKLISVGNEADLSVGEIGKMLVDDINTETIILFLETLRSSNEVSEMARLAHSAGKKVITYKLGKSELGKELAKSHTGAIAGSDEAFNAFIKYNDISIFELAGIASIASYTFRVVGVSFIGKSIGRKSGINTAKPINKKINLLSTEPNFNIMSSKNLIDHLYMIFLIQICSADWSQ